MLDTLLKRKKVPVFVESPQQEALILPVDITDWHAEYVAEELDVSSEDAIIATQMKSGASKPVGS